MIVVIVVFGMLFLYIFYYYRVAQSKRQQSKQLEASGPKGAQIAKVKRAEELYYLVGNAVVLFLALGIATAFLLLTDIPIMALTLIAMSIIIAAHTFLQPKTLFNVSSLKVDLSQVAANLPSTLNLRLIVAIGLLLAGAYVFSLMAQEVREDQDGEPWESISGLIDTRNREQVYTYQLDGRTYIGSNFPDDDYTSENTTYNDGQSVTVYYDPENPLRSALDKPTPSEALPLLWVIGMVIVVGTGWIVNQILLNYAVPHLQTNTE